MATLSEGLSVLKGIKSNIKDALMDQRVDMIEVPFSDYAAKIAGLNTVPNIVYSAVEKGYENGAAQAFTHTTPEIIRPTMVMLVNWIVGANANNGNYTTTLYGSVNGTTFETIGTAVAKDTNSVATDNGTQMTSFDVSKTNYKYFRMQSSASSVHTYGCACQMIIFGDRMAVDGSGWTYKTGQLYEMTADTTGTFTASKAGWYSGSSYHAFDNNTSTYVYTNNPNEDTPNQPEEPYVKIMFGKPIKLVELKSSIGYGAEAVTYSRWFSIFGIKEDGTEVELATNNSGDTWHKVNAATQTHVISAENQNIPFVGLVAHRKPGRSGAGWFYLYNIQVTKWYEQV